MKKLNQLIKEKAKALNQWILNQDEVKEFQKYENALQKHPEILQLEDELKALQKHIVNQKNQGNDCSKIIQEYQKKKKEYEENPLVYNYLQLKQDINLLLSQIQDDINEQLKKKVDENDKSLYNQSIK